MADVFISYSRKDREFAKQLVNALEKDKRDVWVDWQDIPRGEDWLNEIKSGIENADTFVLIISQHSLTSEICNYEIEHARIHNKRIIPLILERIEGNTELLVRGNWSKNPQWEQLAKDNWSALGHINWVFADTDDFDAMFTNLVKTIETDFAHVKLHTRYQVRALDWQRANENPSFLLTGDELTSAEDWLSGALEKDPAPTDLHKRFIMNSRQAEDERETRSRRLQNITRIASIAVITLIIVAIGVVVFSTLSIQNVNELREDAEDFADSLQLASRAQDIFNRGDTTLGLSLALEASYIASPPQTERILSEVAYQTATIRVFEGHSATVWSVAFSPDGNQIISGDEEGILILWDVASGNEIRRFEGHPHGIRSASFSPDGSQILVGSGGIIVGAGPGELFLWDVASGNEIRRFEGHPYGTHSVAFSSDGRQILSGGFDGTAILWDISSGEEIRRYGGATLPLTKVAFSPDDDQIVFGLQYDSLTLWDVASGNEIRRFEGNLTWVRSITFSPDGSQVLVGSEDGIILWDVASGDEIHRFEGHSDAVGSVAFSPNGKRFVSGSLDSNLILWDVKAKPF